MVVRLIVIYTGPWTDPYWTHYMDGSSLVLDFLTIEFGSRQDSPSGPKLTAATINLSGSFKHRDNI